MPWTCASQRSAPSAPTTKVAACAAVDVEGHLRVTQVGMFHGAGAPQPHFLADGEEQRQRRVGQLALEQRLRQRHEAGDRRAVVGAETALPARDDPLPAPQRSCPAAERHGVEVSHEQPTLAAQRTGHSDDQVSHLVVAGNPPVRRVVADPRRLAARLAQLAGDEPGDGALPAAQTLDGQQVGQVGDRAFLIHPHRLEKACECVHRPRGEHAAESSRNFGQLRAKCVLDNTVQVLVSQQLKGGLKGYGQPEEVCLISHLGGGTHAIHVVASRPSFLHLGSSHHDLHGLRCDGRRCGCSRRLLRRGRRRSNDRRPRGDDDRRRRASRPDRRRVAGRSLRKRDGQGRLDRIDRPR